jgi:hypothetical protein
MGVCTSIFPLIDLRFFCQLHCYIHLKLCVAVCHFCVQLHVQSTTTPFKCCISFPLLLVYLFCNYIMYVCMYVCLYVSQAVQRCCLAVCCSPAPSPPSYVISLMLPYKKQNAERSLINCSKHNGSHMCRHLF